MPRASYTPVDFTALPGWRDDPVDAVWPAFLVGCRALTQLPSMQSTWQAPCAAAALIDGRDGAAVRAYFESNFNVYRVSASGGEDTGLITGYYEPLIVGSRLATDVFRTPLYAVPDDLLSVDLGSLYPELKDKRVRGRLDGKRVVPYWARSDIERGTAPVAGKAIAFVAEPIDAFFLQIQGSGRIQLGDAIGLRPALATAATVLLAYLLFVVVRFDRLRGLDGNVDPLVPAVVRPVAAPAASPASTH